VATGIDLVMSKFIPHRKEERKPRTGKNKNVINRNNRENSLQKGDNGLEKRRKKKKKFAATSKGLRTGKRY